MIFTGLSPEKQKELLEYLGRVSWLSQMSVRTSRMLEWHEGRISPHRHPEACVHEIYRQDWINEGRLSWREDILLTSRRLERELRLNTSVLYESLEEITGRVTIPKGKVQTVETTLQAKNEITANGELIALGKVEVF